MFDDGNFPRGLLPQFEKLGSRALDLDTTSIHLMVKHSAANQFSVLVTIGRMLCEILGEMRYKLFANLVEVLC